MFYLIDNITGKVTDSSNTPFSAVGFTTLEITFSEEELEILNNGGCYINAEVVITPEYQEYLKKKDIKAFCDAYNLVTNISYKLASCNENINKQGCTAANKELIQMQIDDFELKLNTAETDRDTLLLAGVTEYTDGSNAQRLALVQEFNDALIGNT